MYNDYERQLKSQSPQTGQFNSYMNSPEQPTIYTYYRSQSPQAGQFNSYEMEAEMVSKGLESQSPQAGQFNSYGKYGKE